MYKPTLKHALYLLAILTTLVIYGCVENSPPYPEARASERQIDIGQSVTLDGSHSWDYNDDPLTYSWLVVEAPQNSGAMPDHPDEATTMFTPDLPGRYTVELSVDDGQFSTQDEVVIIVVDIASPGQGSGDGSQPGHPPAPHPEPIPEHLNLDRECVKCHDGVTASGKSSTHINSTNTCYACHNALALNGGWIPAIRVDHAQVIGVCRDCHMTPEPHQPTPEPCDKCHNTFTWTNPTGEPPKPGEPVPNRHIPFNSACIECHDNVNSVGKSANHIESSDKCETCHHLDNWRTQMVDHMQLQGKCVDCHDGRLASGKSSAHIDSSADCDMCHSTTAWVPAITVDHNAVIGTCVSCHNAVIAPGLNTSHLSTSEVCEACHSVKIWVPVIAVDHKEVTGVCSSCHNGRLAHGLTPDHIETNEQECDVCHNTSNWIVR